MSRPHVECKTLLNNLEFSRNKIKKQETNTAKWYDKWK